MAEGDIAGNPAWTEFVQTEETYQETLLMMSSLGKAMVAFKLADCEVTNSIFLNTEELLECNKELLRLVRVRGEGDVRQLAYAFSACSDEMQRVYKPYLQQYKTAEAFLGIYLREERFMALVNPFVETMELMRKHREPVTAATCMASPRRVVNVNLKCLLVAPVQRICKYELMLKEMLKRVNHDAELTMQLNAAYNCSKTLCNMIDGGLEVAAPLDTSAKKLLKKLERTTSKRGSVIDPDGLI